jgi:hypothetical protein
MSPAADPRVRTNARRGFALLLALVTTVVVGLCVLALWQTQAGTLRHDRLRTAAIKAGSDADSALAVAVAEALAGGWRSLTVPGATQVTPIPSADGVVSASMVRLGWNTLLLRGTASERSGLQSVRAFADDRLLVPLAVPFAMPQAAMTGGRGWTVHAAATVDFTPPLPAEQRCRDGVLPMMAAIDTARTVLDPTLVTLLDPDTVSAPLVGVFRLIRDRIIRPLVVSGMVESVTGLSVQADLQIAGVLVVQGSVQPAGGRLDVTGAVITSDSGGGHSGLGNGDRIRYDACAIRRAMERATRPAPAVAWTVVGRS